MTINWKHLRYNFELFQLTLGQAAARALAQNNGTRYTVGNIYDAICKYRHCHSCVRDGRITMRIFVKLDGVDYTSKTRLLLMDKMRILLARISPTSNIYEKCFNNFLNCNEVNFTEFKLSVGMTHPGYTQRALVC
jgi:hypothetical protein